MATKVRIGGELESTTVEGIIADAKTIIDREHGNKRQEVMNGELAEAIAGKQQTLVSGTNIKTVNGNSLLGSGDLEVGGGASVGTLNTTNTTAQSPVSSESFSGNINLHKISKTGDYTDLNNKPTIPDVSGKADKVSGATENDFAGLDSNGNLKDSGKKASDFQAALVSGTNIKTINNESILGSGNINTAVDVSGKADKVTGATAGDFAGLDANGNLKDSGKKASDFATAAQGALADTAYQKPSGGIPSTDLTQGVQDSLDAADAAAPQSTTYTKSQVDTLVNGLSGNSLVIGALPASGVAGTLYRVPGTGSYTDYMWDGTQFVPLATYSANTEGYGYVGLATPSTNPGSPTNKVFYFAHEAGTYGNFLDSNGDPLVIAQGINVLKFDGTNWSSEQLVGIDDVPISGSENLVKSGAVYDGIKAVEQLIEKETLTLNNVSAGVYRYDFVDGRQYTVNYTEGTHPQVTLFLRETENGPDVQEISPTSGYTPVKFTANQNAKYLRIGYVAVGGGIVVSNDNAIQEQINNINDKVGGEIVEIENYCGKQFEKSSSGKITIPLSVGKTYIIKKNADVGEVNIFYNNASIVVELSSSETYKEFTIPVEYDDTDEFYLNNDAGSDVSIYCKDSLNDRVIKLENPEQVQSISLTQSILDSWENKLVEIKDNYILTGSSDFTFPENCKIVFRGGKFVNQSFTGDLYPNGTFIESAPYTIFDGLTKFASVNTNVPVNETLEETGHFQVNLKAGVSYRIQSNMDGAYILRYPDDEIIYSSDYDNPFEFVSNQDCNDVYFYSPVSGLTLSIVQISNLEPLYLYFRADIGYAEWFGAVGNGEHPDAYAFNLLDQYVDCTEIHLVADKKYDVEQRITTNKTVRGATGALFIRDSVFAEVPLGSLSGITADADGNITLPIDTTAESYSAESVAKLTIGRGICITATDTDSMYNFDQKEYRQIVAITDSTIKVSGGDLQIQGGLTGPFSLVTEYPIVRLYGNGALINVEVDGGYLHFPKNRAHWWFGYSVCSGLLGTDSDTTKIEGCYIHDNVADGVLVEGFNSLISHNRIEHSGSNGIHMGELNQCTITENYVFDSNLNNADERDSTHGVGHNDGAITYSNNITNVVIDRNVLDNCKVGIASIDTADDCKSIITNNTIISFRRYGIQGVAVETQDYGATYKDYIVANNRILNGQQDIENWELQYMKVPYKARTISKEYGIAFMPNYNDQSQIEGNGKWQNLNISGNLLRECGMFLGCAENASITNNNITFIHNRTTETAGSNILNRITASNVILNGNTILENSNSIATIFSISNSKVMLCNNFYRKRSVTDFLAQPTSDTSVITENNNVEY